LTFNFQDYPVIGEVDGCIKQGLSSNLQVGLSAFYGSFAIVFVCHRHVIIVLTDRVCISAAVSASPHPILLFPCSCFTCKISLGIFDIVEVFILLDREKQLPFSNY